MAGRRSLRLAHRLTLVFSLIVFAMAGAVYLAMEGYFRNTLTRNSELRAMSRGNTLGAVSRPHLLNYDWITLQQVADAATDHDEVVYVAIFDKEGKVAGYSDNRQLQGRLLEDESTVRALSVEDASVFRTTWADRENHEISVIEAVIPVSVQGSGQRWGTIRLGFSLERMAQQLWATRMILAAMAASGVLAAILASHFLARRITMPLVRLVDAAQRLEKGEGEFELSIDSQDEIGELAQRFAQSAESLDRQKRELILARDELKLLNATLEDKVEKRTAELSASREKYRLLVEGSPDAFVLLKGDRFLFVNAAFEQIFGLEGASDRTEEICWTQVIHPNFHAIAQSKLREIDDRGTVITGEWIGVTSSGATVDLEVRGRGVNFDGDDAVELVLTDITEKKRLLRQVAQNERLRAMGEMTAMVAHHFNNILAIIHGRAQLVQRKIDDPSLSASLEVIQSSVIKAGEMVRHLQDYFGEQVDLRFARIDLNSMIEEVVKYQEQVWRTMGTGDASPVTFAIELNEVPPVRGVDPLLQDAFRRVLANASEAMPDGGEIRVRTFEQNGNVFVEIVDQGVGMNEEVRRHAFDPFFTTKDAGGLGLCASLGILQRHEGRIEIDSEQGRGTTVRVVLPVESRISKIVPVDGLEGRSEPLPASKQGHQENRANEAGGGDHPSET